MGGSGLARRWEQAPLQQGNPVTGELNVQKSKARELILEAFDIASRMQRANLSAINRQRPPKLRYKAQADLVRDFIAQASAMLDFAGKLGLFTPEEATAILQEFGSRHPELDDWLMR